MRYILISSEQEEENSVDELAQLVTQLQCQQVSYTSMKFRNQKSDRLALLTDFPYSHVNLLSL